MRRFTGENETAFPNTLVEQTGRTQGHPIGKVGTFDAGGECESARGYDALRHRSAELARLRILPYKGEGIGGLLNRMEAGPNHASPPARGCERG